MGLKPTQVVLRHIATNTLLPLETPKNWKFLQGLEQTIYERRNEGGELVYNESQVDARKQMLEMTLPRWTEILLSLYFGYELTDSAVTDGVYARGFRLSDQRNREIAAAALGFWGQGIAEDEPTFQGSAIIDGRQQVLTRVANAGFDFTAARSFSVGADGNFKFTDDLPKNGLVVVRGEQGIASANVLDDEEFQEFEADVYGVLQFTGGRKIVHINMPRLELARDENTDVDTTLDEVPLKLRDLTGSCRANFRTYPFRPAKT